MYARAHGNVLGFRAGELVEVDPDVAEVADALAGRHLVEVDPPEPDGDDGGGGVAGLTGAQIDERLRGLGLSTSGKVAVRRERLADALAAIDEGDAAADDTGGE